MVRLDTIVTALSDAGVLVATRGDMPDVVTGVADDSRRVMPGGLFVAVRGSERDGRTYLANAERAGAAVAVVEESVETSLPVIVVRHGRRAAAIAAAAVYGCAARELTIVGVTGTNGKTTTVNMLRHLLDDPRRRSASIGTLGVLVGTSGDAFPGGDGLTTPGPVELQRVLRGLVDAGVAQVAMEASSHALHQDRLEGLSLTVAVFTNLTQDHLDYHGTMEAYRDVKLRLLELLDPSGTAVVNIDDEAWTSLAAARRLTFSERSAAADVRAEGVEFMADGSEWTLVASGDRHDVRLPLIGDFNVVNALGAAAAAAALGLSPLRIAERLSTMPQVPGRLERITGPGEPTVLRDYAHTPDALDRALAAVRPFTAGRLIVAFGCGGDRDRTKRPRMGAIAAARADVAIVTSDNPRTEDPERILDEIEAGMGSVAHERVEDRRAAIDRALSMARPDDVIVLAGKGHETYQVRGTTRLPFDEKLVVAELLGQRSPASSEAT